MKKFFVFLIFFTLLALPTAFASSSSIEVNGKTYEVNYEATGLIVEDIEADIGSGTLSIFVNTSEDDGTLVLTLDRTFFDSQTDGLDDEFLILADTEEAIFTEEKTTTSRTLTITIPSGTNIVDINSLGKTNFGTDEITPLETPEPISGDSNVVTQETPKEPLQTPEQLPIEIPKTESKSEQPMEIPLVQSQKCGPGTILKDGECVVDQMCGPGTILKEGECVLDTSIQTQDTKSMSKEFVIAVIASFIIAIIVMFVLWAIGKAGRAKN